MPSPEVIRLIEQFRRRLDALDAAAAADMIQAYGPIWTRISAETEALLAQIEGQQMTFVQVEQVRRYEELLLQARRRVEAYAIIAEGRITAAQREAVRLSLTGVQGIVDAALPAGIDTNLLARVGITWTRLPVEAFEVFVGMAGDGGPLERLLRPLGAEASNGIREGIREGIALGRGPRETADLIRQRFGMPLTRSLAISRTETLRSYREASRLQYNANRDIVKGYRRHSARDDRVCAACMALDGTEQPTDEMMPVHVNDRCAVTPITVTYRDLGLPVDQAPGDESTARDWFGEQSEATQRRMLGPGRFEAWQTGKVKLTELAKVMPNATWGPSAAVKTLAELGV